MWLAREEAPQRIYRRNYSRVGGRRAVSAPVSGLIQRPRNMTYGLYLRNGKICRDTEETKTRKVTTYVSYGTYNGKNILWCPVILFVGGPSRGIGVHGLLGCPVGHLQIDYLLPRKYRRNLLMRGKYNNYHNYHMDATRILVCSC